MATLSKEYTSYRVISGFTTTAPVAGDTWTLWPTVDSPFEDKEEMGFDEGREANSIGAPSPPVPTVPSGSGGGLVRDWGGSKAFDGVGGDADPTACFMQGIHENFFGAAAVTSFTGTTVAAPGTAGGQTAPIVVTSATGLAVGMAVMVGAVGGSAAEVRFIEAISGVNVTLDQDLSAANRVTGSIIYGAFNFVPTLGTYGSYVAINVVRDGYSRMYWPSRISEMELSKVAAKDGVRLRHGFMADNWTAGVTPSSTPTDAFRSNSALIGVGAPFAFNRTTVVVTDFQCKFGIKHEEQPATSGDRGRQGYEAVEFNGEGSFTEYFLDSRFTSDLKNGTTGPLRMVVMAAGLNTVKARNFTALWVPNAHIKVERAPIEGKLGAKVSFKMLTPTATQQAAGINKPFYFAKGGGN